MNENNNDKNIKDLNMQIFYNEEPPKEEKNEIIEEVKVEELIVTKENKIIETIKEDIKIETKSLKNNTNNIHTLSANDEALLRIFIGDEYGKFVSTKFNIFSFLFSSFYMFYRKMYKYGIITFTLSILLYSIFNSLILNILFNVLIAFITNKLYLSYSIQKIQKIKLNNPNKEFKELLNICEQEGRTSFTTLLLGCASNIGISLIALLISFLIGLTTPTLKILNDIGINSIDDIISSESKYDGKLIIDIDTRIQKDIDITLPSIFNNNNSSLYTINYSYKYNNDIYNECIINIASPLGYTSSKELIKEMEKYHKKNIINKQTETKINNIKWNYISYKNNFGKYYYYATDINDKVYLLEYQIQINSDPVCSNYKDQIINTIMKK